MCCLMVCQLQAQQLPQPDTLRLNNGLKVYLLPLGGDSVLSIRLLINGGKKNETVCEVGYSEMIGGFLNARLKEKQGRLMHEDFLFSSNAEGQTVSTGSCSIRDVEKQLALLSTVLSQLAFKKRQADSLAHALIDAYNPEYLSADRLADVYRDLVVYGSRHPLGRSYCQYQLQKALPIELREFYLGHYTPQNASLIICGNFKISVIRKMIAKQFIKWRALRNEAITEAHELPVPELKSRNMAFVHVRDSAHYLLKWVFSAASFTSADQAAFRLVCTLFENYLSEEMKKMQALSGDTLQVYPLVYTTHFMEINIRAGQSVMQVIQRMDSILGQFRRLQLTETDVADALGKLKAGYLKINTPASVLAFYDPLLYPFDRRCHDPETLPAIASADLQRVQKKYLDPAAYQLIVVGKEQPVERISTWATITHYTPWEFETCDEACKEVVLIRCHCDVCWNRGQCKVWRFNPNQKEAIKRARAKMEFSPK